MVILVNYANEKFKKAQRLNSFMARYVGKFDQIIECSPEKIEDDFKKQHHDILSIQRGNGLWLWKPYFVDRILNNMENGDILFYCDSGAFFIRNKKYILNSMGSDDIWATTVPLPEKQFTKKDTLDGMGCLTTEYTESNQIQATFFAIRKTAFTTEFVKEWLKLCCRQELLDGDMCTMPNETFFIAHREDQSIFSLLCKKYHIKTAMDPTQYGRIPIKFKQENYIYIPKDYKRTYPVSILLHRQDKPTVFYLFKCLLHIILPKGLVTRMIRHV